MDAVIKRARKAAAALGANGVLLAKHRHRVRQRGQHRHGTGFGIGGGLSIGTGIFTASDNKTGRGLAIYVPTQSPQ